MAEGERGTEDTEVTEDTVGTVPREGTIRLAVQVAPGGPGPFSSGRIVPMTVLTFSRYAI